MTAQELAAKLDGRTYGSEATDDECNAAFDAGLVIVFGASDDLAEFRGKIDDEVGCYDGGTIYLTSAGLLTNPCSDSRCPYFEKAKESAATIEAVFDEEGYTWIYKTDIPHATFDIMEEGEKYCRGMVFRLSDVKEKA
jgi:hypothetical protein